MMNIQPSGTLSIDQNDRFDFFKAEELARGEDPYARPGDIASKNNAIPETGTQILDLSFFRSAAGLFRSAISGLLLAGACLAGAHGARANQPASQQDAVWPGETGLASYYGSRHQGRRTASGRLFDMRALTAAHPWLPFGTKVRVTVVATGRSVVVTITDRLPSRRRAIDLSLSAAHLLGIITQGLAEVSLTPA